jgi:hypothetical protein
MLYASCNKINNFGTCKHHGIRFINCLFMKLIILYKPFLNIIRIQKGIKMTLFDISNDFFDEFVQ